MKECCANCRYMFAKKGNVNWITMYFCTVDGDDRFLGKFDNYTGYAINTAWSDLGRRCCRFFKKRDTHE